MAQKKAAGARVPAGTRITPAKRRAFLKWLSQTANVTRAAREAGLDRSAIYRLRQRSEAFRTSWNDAMNEALDELEATLFERATQGVERPVFYGGKPCGTVRQYSDALGMFILRARRPHVFGKAGPDSDKDESADGKTLENAARDDVLERIGRMADRLHESESVNGAASDDALRTENDEGGLAVEDKIVAEGEFAIEGRPDEGD